MAGGGSECGGYKRYYKISGYTDGMISFHPGCTNETGPPVWNGDFEALTNNVCVWRAIGTFFWTSADGKALLINTGGVNYTVIRLSGGNWYVDIYCSGPTCGPTTKCLMWRGVKSVGDTPVGIYTRIDGYDTTATINIVEGP